MTFRGHKVTCLLFKRQIDYDFKPDNLCLATSTPHDYRHYFLTLSCEPHIVSHHVTVHSVPVNGGIMLMETAARLKREEHNYLKGV